MKTEMKAEENASVIDTSKMSSAQRAALEMTEAARDTPGAKRGFCGGLFLGHFDLGALHCLPTAEHARDRLGFRPAENDVAARKLRLLFVDLHHVAGLDFNDQPP